MSGGKLAIVRGGGDLATGVIYRLWKARFSVLCLERPEPLVVRRTVAAAEAVFSGQCTVEDMRIVKINSLEEWRGGADVAVLVDPGAEAVAMLHPSVVIDATMTKRYNGIKKDCAPLVLALGPGFSAPEQVHGVIETKRGHALGRLITDGSAIPDTGIPGSVNGYTTERILRAPCRGRVAGRYKIGDYIRAGDTVATVNGWEVRSKIDGVLRGLVHPSVTVGPGVKIGDVDPRGDRSLCFTITDKALAVAGGVLEAILHFGVR